MKDNIIVKIWATEECRDLGLSEIACEGLTDLDDARHKAQKTIDNCNAASVEVIRVNKDGEEVLWGTDGADEWFGA